MRTIVTVKTKKFLVPLFLALGPSFTSAQNFNNIENGIVKIGEWVSAIIPLLIMLATLYFFWKTAQFVMNATNEDKREEGKKGMIWGVVAVFVIVSFWGLVGFLTRTFNVGNTPTGAVAPSVQNLPP